MGVKNKILSYLPISKRRMLRELKNLESRLEELSLQLSKTESKLSEQLDDANRATCNMLSTQNDRNLEALIAQLQSVESSTNESIETASSKLEQITEKQTSELHSIRNNQNDKVLWANRFEKNIVSANWGDVMSRDDFANKFSALVSGMDRQSTAEIVKIISRQHKYLSSEANTLDLFTHEEVAQIRKLHDEFSSRIIRLSDDCFFYDGYYLPINHFESSVFYFKHGADQIKHPEAIAGRDIIDVGGFIGDSVLVLEDLCPRSIVSFEGDPDNYALMQKTLEMNGIKNALPINVALSSEKGSTRYYRLGSMSSSVKRDAVDYDDEFEMKTTTLDDYCAQNPDLDIALIKVDIEGAEPLFLQGAYETIKRYKPIILLSIYHNAHDFFELKPLIESWNLGYTFSIHKPVFGNLTSETLLICEPHTDESL